MLKHSQRSSPQNTLKVYQKQTMHMLSKIKQRIFKGQKRHRQPKDQATCSRDEVKMVNAGYWGSISDTYRLGKKLGKGKYGVVYEATKYSTDEKFAIKCINKARVSNLEVLRREIDIMKRLPSHPNIVELHEVVEDSEFLWLVQDLCQGGDLFDKITAGKMAPDVTKQIVGQILSAVNHCHMNGIVHRDLKPENIVMSSCYANSEIKLIDFGLSQISNSHSDIPDMKTRVGTPYYVAPEVLKKCYTHKCDLWSVGVITYVLLCGYPPFWGDTDEQIFSMVRSGNFDFPKEEWDSVSNSAKNLVRRLLTYDPSSRLSAAEAMKHDWFRHDPTTTTRASMSTMSTITAGTSSFRSNSLCSPQQSSDM